MDTVECSCGSGREQRALYDGYGIFMCYACSECRDRKVRSFRPDIFTRYECDEPIEESD